MSQLKIDFDVRVIDEQDYVPFEQVMQMLRNLDEFTPNVDLSEIAQSLEDQRDAIRRNS